MNNVKIAFIGAGNMNGAIIKGLVANGYPADNIIVSNPSLEKREALHQSLGIRHTANNAEAATFADFIVLGVKPHLIHEVCESLKDIIVAGNKTVLSVAAGVTLESMQKRLGNIAIVRTMPNTPSQVGLGVTGLFASTECEQVQKDTAGMIMASVGNIVWLDSEDDIDHVIAISGSGPAYFFLFMEALEEQALALGFSANQAREMVQQTALGAATMVRDNPELSIETLRQNVTSKGGTTNAAIEKMKSDHIPQHIKAGALEALARAKEMAAANK
ncbi:pyrroline-5-carboxylate reductase [Thalassotalea agarivorans]|uniref:Pyrroline-5-carboxylate reductase n=1 Tax=Thalassotalea agarivorans TaxID=349064 RepID=A0A1I0HJ40_THASX|nr:pyrroline-5-carboxylate reductase [Thalassotalea agarivorans]SET83102.1 pyrroline-5-carboxylate reductase [Thalassotalea agarivorans]